MKTFSFSPELLDRYGSAAPEIYFDEPQLPLTGGRELSQYSAIDFLNALSGVFELVRDRRDWRILLLRARGRSYRSIAGELEIGVATVERFIRRTVRQNRELGVLLMHADAICASDREKRNIGGD